MAVQSKLVLATKAARPFFLAVTRFGTCVVNYTDNPSVLDLRTRLPRQTAHEIKGTSIVNPAVNGGGNAAATLLGHDPGHFAPAACSHGCLVPKNSSNRHQPGPCIQPKHRITFQSTSFTTLKQLRAQSKHFKHLHTTLTANGGAVTTNNGHFIRGSTEHCPTPQALLSFILAHISRCPGTTALLHWHALHTLRHST